MRNRIKHLTQQTSCPSLVATAVELCRRPTLTLTMDRPFKVDMECFFDFSFSFAEALIDLEEKYLPAKPVVPLERELRVKAAVAAQDPHDLDIDARWM